MLRKSIIRVEIPDINLGEGAPPTQEGVQKDVEMDGAGDSAQEAEPMTLSWDDYQRIANLFVLKLRQEEEQAEQLGNVKLLFMLFMTKYVWGNMIFRRPSPEIYFFSFRMTEELIH